MFARNKPDVTEAIERVLEGEVNAYEVVYKEFDRPLRAWLGKRYFYLGGDFIAETAVRTFEVAFHDLHRFDPERTRFLTWLIWQARNVARRVRRERYPPRAGTVCPARSEPGPEEEREYRERDEVVRRELARLKSPGRECVTLHDLEGRTFEETCRLTGMPMGSVWRARARALAVLRRRLQEQGVRWAERDSTPQPTWYGRDDTGYDDDWTATSTAKLPVEPVTRTGAAAKEPEV
jgi:RNA polymerase sigma factor (sigma-70 family)